MSIKPFSDKDIARRAEQAAQWQRMAADHYVSYQNYMSNLTWGLAINSNLRISYTQHAIYYQRAASDCYSVAMHYLNQLLLIQNYQKHFHAGNDNNQTEE